MSQQTSKKVIAIVIAIVVIIGIPVAVRLANKPKPVDDATRMAFQMMTSDLRGLAMAQAATKLQVGHYAAQAERSGYLQSPGVTMPVVTLSDTGWAAVVGYKTLPGIRCAIGVYTRNPIKRFARSGEVVCE